MTGKQVFGYMQFDEPLKSQVLALRAVGWSCHEPVDGEQGFSCCIDGDWLGEHQTEELAWREAAQLEFVPNHVATRDEALLPSLTNRTESEVRTARKLVQVGKDYFDPQMSGDSRVQVLEYDGVASMAKVRLYSIGTEYNARAEFLVPCEAVVDRNIKVLAARQAKPSDSSCEP